jgi:hypothetical protein
MAITDEDVMEAEKRMAAIREEGFAVSARYDRRAGRIVVELNTGLQIAFPTRLAEGLADATPDKLADVEIDPGGLGLHWPKLDADLYVPALLGGAFGSKRWMAAQLGASGGRAQSGAKAAAARENGRKGGRPRKRAQDDPSLVRLGAQARTKPARQGAAKAKLTAAERKALAKERKLAALRAQRVSKRPAAKRRA